MDQQQQEASSLATTPTSDQSGGQATPLPTVTSSGNIKLPPYWHGDPALWFSQVKAQFTTRNITAERTKYVYIGSLQPEVAQEVRDLLINPPAENPYSQLKKELVKRTSASEQQRLNQLLNVEQLVDRKGDNCIAECNSCLAIINWNFQLFWKLFLQHLLTNAQLILASTKDNLDTESLAKLADKILEVAPTHPTHPLHSSSTI